MKSSQTEKFILTTSGIRKAAILITGTADVFTEATGQSATVKLITIISTIQIMIMKTEIYIMPIKENSPLRLIYSNGYTDKQLERFNKLKQGLEMLTTGYFELTGNLPALSVDEMFNLIILNKETEKYISHFKKLGFID